MTTVLKIGGSSVQDPANVARLAAAWHDAPEGWTIVHGGGPQLDTALAAFGPAVRVDGLRVTPLEHMPVMRRVLDGIGARLVDELRAHGVPATHVPSHWGLLHAEPKLSPGGDLGRVGDPTGFAVDVLRRIRPAGTVTVMGPIGWDLDGPFNVNADEAACAIAAALQADRLILATDVPHVRGAGGVALAHVTPEAAEDLIRSGLAAGGMVPKLRAALDAMAEGVSSVRIGPVDAAWTEAGTVIAPKVLA